MVEEAYSKGLRVRSGPKTTEPLALGFERKTLSKAGDWTRISYRRAEGERYIQPIAVWLLAHQLARLDGSRWVRLEIAVNLDRRTPSAPSHGRRVPKSTRAPREGRQQMMRIRRT